MAIVAIDRESAAEALARRDNDPVTLHRTMQTVIGEGLREHYQPPQRLSHELFVVLMQLREEERRHEAIKRAPRRSRGSPHDPASSGHAAEMAEHTRHVDQAGNDKGDDEHRVHRRSSETRRTKGIGRRIGRGA
jgi:hypothetical protein